MNRSILCALLISWVSGACGSNTDSNSGSNSGATLPTLLGDFAGSCMLVISTAALKATSCEDSYGISQSSAQSGCKATPDSGITATYSADHCPTANLLGTCTASTDGAKGTVFCYYSGGTDTKADHQISCAGSNASWKDP